MTKAHAERSKTRKSKPKKARRPRSQSRRTSKRTSTPIDIAGLREQAGQVQQGEGQELVNTLLSTIESLTAEREAFEAEHERQKLRIKQLLLMLYGRKSEKLSKEQLHQLVLAFGGTDEQAGQDEPSVPAPEPPPEGGKAAGADQPKDGKGKKRRKRRARMTLSPDAERIVKDVPVPPEERQCACCHREMSVIGHVEHETIEYVPAKVVAHVERREKMACRHSDCRGDIHTAARTQGSLGRRVGTSLLAYLIEAKCADSLPIDRQRDQLARLGLSIPLNTLYSYWNYITSLLSPVAKVTLGKVLADAIVGVDDTKLRVLDKRRPKGSYKGCLWCFTGTGPLVAYTFTESWEAEAIAPYIGAIEGFVQCDDYKGYGSEVEMPDGAMRVLVPPERRLACMMHVRRHFVDALKLGDKRAARPVEIIAEIYDIERQAKERDLDADGRLALRTERSAELLKAFETWVDDMQPKCLPKSPLGSAIGYARQQRPYIRRCFTDGRFEIDNGHTERTIRKPCIGRNNFLFTGSAEAAERLAGAYTLVQSCRNVGISTRDYLIDVVDKLEAGWPMRRIDELVPDQWARLQGPLASSDQAAQ